MAPKKDGGGRRKGPKSRIDVQHTPVAERQRLFSECSDDQCSVCWNDIKIFAVGMCNHSVCHVCSTRMRVLCSQNDCAICRQDMPLIAFSKTRTSFKEMADRVLPKDKRYQICFEDESIKKMYEDLLTHRCPLCPSNPPVTFRTFKQLDTHMRREHERFYCELCVTHLKIFSHERKFYNRSELATHRRKGDTDDSSHKGHPLCQFCEVRFVDDEELFRHLRRDHYFCHFCDADGVQAYYQDYNLLRDHFKSDHFLCEEGDCINDQFTHAFRTDLDLKAHRLERHSGGLSKNESKLNRIVGIDLSFNRPTPGSYNQHERRHGGGRQSPPESTANQKNEAKVPHLAEDFPTLGASGKSTSAAKSSSKSGNTSANSGNMASRLALLSGHNIQSSWGSQGSRLQDQDFPSLPGSNPGPPPPPSAQYMSKKSSSKSSDVQSGKSKQPQMDFPSLPNSNNPMHAFGAPIYRNPNGYTPAWSNNQDQQQPKPSSANNKGSKKFVAPAPDLDFPSLEEPSQSTKATQSNNPTTNNKGKKKKGKKVDEPASHNGSLASMATLKSAADLIFSENNSKKQTAKTEPEKVSPVKTVAEPSPPAQRSREKLNVAATPSTPSFANSNIANTATSNRAPPPGFATNTKISHHRPDPKFIEPTNFAERNSKLFTVISTALGGGKSLDFDSFKKVSHQYKANVIDSQKYVKECALLLDDSRKLDDFMPELIALLPNIGRQKELYTAFLEHYPQSTVCKKIQPCPNCGQFLAGNDKRIHMQTHALDTEFPAL